MDHIEQQQQQQKCLLCNLQMNTETPIQILTECSHQFHASCFKFESQKPGWFGLCPQCSCPLNESYIDFINSGFCLCLML